MKYILLCLLVIIGLSQAQEFTYPLKAPIEVFGSCEHPLEAVTEGFCVIDGDTLRVLLDKGDGWYQFTSLRITGVNTPESRTTNDREKALAARIKAAVTDLLAGLNPADIKIVSLEKAKFYGRTIGDLQLYSDPSFSFSKWLIANQLAQPYEGEARTGWTEEQLDFIEEGLENIEY